MVPENRVNTLKSTPLGGWQWDPLSQQEFLWFDTQESQNLNASLQNLSKIHRRVSSTAQPGSSLNTRDEPGQPFGAQQSGAQIQIPTVTWAKPEGTDKDQTQYAIDKVNSPSRLQH